ncbi:hypothetical protein JCM16303_000188 [Sporobolomyces ruberrimus]
MTTSSPVLASSSSKPHLSSLSVGPTPHPPPSLAAASPSNSHVNSRRIASWGSVNSESGLSVLGERGMTPLPSPMDNREWGFLPSASGERSGGGMSSLSKSQSRRCLGSEDSPSVSGGGKSWMSNFHQHQAASPTPSSPSHSHVSPTLQPQGSTSRERTEPTRSKTLSFFDSSSPVIAPSASSSSLLSNDPSTLLLSPPPNPPSRNNSLNSRPPTYQPNRPRSSSRLSISDLPTDPLRSSTTSTSSWLDEFAPANAGAGGGVSWGKRRDRVTSIGSWSSEVNKAARLRTETSSTNDSIGEATGGSSTPVERRLFMDLDASTANGVNHLNGFETVKNSPDRPRLAQLDTTFSDTPIQYEGTSRPRERSVSNISTGSSAYRPLSSLPTAVEASPTLLNSQPRARFLDHGHAAASSSPHRSSSPSYRDSPPPPIDLSSLPRRNFLAPDATRSKGSATPRTPPSMEELQKIIGGATISESPSKGATGPKKEGIEDGDRVGEYSVVRLLGKGAFSRVALAQKDNETKQVALKLMDRKSCEGNERMRISVLREVEVLKNISHPSLVTLSSSFLTPLYTVLVLDYCPGGELFDFLAEHHAKVTEGLARRMFGELCDAVGWMHRVGLVHRDIKLENILLTSRLFPLPLGGSTDPLDHVPTPFVKLTDFGLSRFINPASPLLQTRCGSEAYAAPELLMGKPYDGTLTDSWAVGVVLYAIVTGGLPFVEEEEVSRERGEGLERRVSTRGGRKGYLLKIAKAEYSWPAPETTIPGRIAIGKELKDLVSRLLVRDPNKRWRIDGRDLWESEWMRQGEGQVRRVEGIVRSSEADMARRRGSDQVDFNDSRDP